MSKYRTSEEIRRNALRMLKDSVLKKAVKICAYGNCNNALSEVEFVDDFCIVCHKKNSKAIEKQILDRKRQSSDFGEWS